MQVHIELCLCLQGDEADCMFFIEDGEVKITVKNKVINYPENI